MSNSRLAAGSTFSTGDGNPIGVAASAVQTITMTGTATAGGFNLLYSGGFNHSVQATAAMQTTLIAYNATGPIGVQAALVALPNIGNNAAGLPNVAVSGAAGGPYIVTFQNDLANQPVPLLTVGTTLPTGVTAITPALTTPGVALSETFTSVAELTTLPTPQVKRAKKEVTNFDSTGFTKEFIPELIDPGDVKLDANYIGDASQDYITGLLFKFNAGLIYSCRVNIPNYLVGPTTMSKGMLMSFKGFFTDAAVNNAKVADVLSFMATLGITGQVSYGKPLQ